MVEEQALNGADMQAALEAVGQRGVGGTSYVSALTAAMGLIIANPTMRSHVVLLSDGRPADTKAKNESWG